MRLSPSPNLALITVFHSDKLILFCCYPSHHMNMLMSHLHRNDLLKVCATSGFLIKRRQGQTIMSTSGGVSMGDSFLSFSRVSALFQRIVLYRFRFWHRCSEMDVRPISIRSVLIRGDMLLLALDGSVGLLPLCILLPGFAWSVVRLSKKSNLLLLTSISKEKQP